MRRHTAEGGALLTTTKHATWPWQAANSVDERALEALMKRINKDTWWRTGTVEARFLAFLRASQV